MHVFRSATLLEWLCTSVSLHKCHCIPGLHHGAGHVLHVGDVGESRRHLEEHVRGQPRPRHRHHPLLTMCNVRPGTRRLFSQDLCLCSSLVASSRCSSFNSFTVAVSHLTLSKSVIVSLPRHNIPVTVSKNKIFFKQHVELFSDFNSTTVRHSFAVFDQPRHWSFLKSMSRFSEENFISVDECFCLVMEALDTLTLEVKGTGPVFSRSSQEKLTHNWLITPFYVAPGQQQTEKLGSRDLPKNANLSRAQIDWCCIRF